MRRLLKDRCGYKGYICQGIALLPPPKAIGCDNRTQFGDSDSRSIDNNFYNIPSRFLGIVQQTRYIDLDGVQQSSSCCNFEYDPFDPSGFSNLFEPVSRNQHYIDSLDYSGLADYGCSNSTYYASDALQKPGILLPSPELNPFYPPVLQAVPTVALASPVSVGSHGFTPIYSGCDGFRIINLQNRPAGVKISVLVTGGQAIVGNTGTTVRIEGTTINVNSYTLQIYVKVWYDFSEWKWAGELIYKTGGGFNNLDGAKIAQIGTVVRTEDDVIQIIQQTCSPVDVRDWVSQVTLPRDGTGGILYVFTYMSGSTQKRWLPVKDC